MTRTAIAAGLLTAVLALAALALIGMAWWLEGRDRPAIAALCLAALCRESALLVPLALALSALPGAGSAW